MAHRRNHGGGVGQLGADRHLVAWRKRAVVRGGYHEFDAQGVDHGHAQQGTVLDALAGVDVALDHHAGEGAAHGAQRQLGVGHVALLDPHALLAAHLAQALAGHFGFAPGLLDGLVGHETLRHQCFGAAHLLLGQVQAGLGGQDLGVDARPRLGSAGVGALDVGAQADQRLAGRYGLAALDIQPLDHADDLRSDLGHAVGFDQAAHRLGRGAGRGCRRVAGGTGRTQSQGQETARQKRAG